MEIPKAHQVVPVTVTGHLPGGLLVEVTDGKRGVIRLRELSWDTSTQSNWQQRFPIGWKSEALVVKEDHGQLELSLRLLQDDPWSHIHQLVQPHQALRGIVTGSKHYGAFVEIASGLTGLLHQSCLPAGAKELPDELFWPGDHVCVAVDEIHLKERQISLGLAPVESMPVKKAVHETLPAKRSTLANRFEQLARDTVRLHILIIENDPEQAGSVQSWLEHLDQWVERASSVEEGLQRIEKSAPDLILVDLCLPDIHGLEAVRRMQALAPKARCIATADGACLENYPAEIDALRAVRVDVLAKPLEPEELLELLVDRDHVAMEEDDALFTPQIDPYRQALQAGSASIQALLEECIQAAEFDAAVLFSLDPLKSKVDVVAARGSVSDPLPPLDDLIYSPVRDVAEDGLLFMLEDANQSNRQARFQYLIQAFPFAAALGLRVPCRLPLQYALFLFHPTPREIYSDELNYAQATALVIGNWLEKQLLLERVALQQRVTLVGNQANMIFHEANNQLATINAALPCLLEDLATIEAKWKAGEPIGQTEIEKACSGSNNIQIALNHLTKTIGGYHKLSVAKDYQLVRLDELVQEACDMLSGTSRSASVDIQLVPGDSLLVTRSQVGLLQQVLINLLLNAIQQIKKIRKGGRVRVQIEKVDKFVRFLVADNGPGIHWRWWEQIFEPGFTTRDEGSGLGLYISRSIIQSFGGRIYVAESCILGGTTIAVELPLKL